MSTPEKKSDGSLLPIIILVIIVLFSASGAAFMGWMYLKNNQALTETKMKKEAAEKEKQAVEEQLISLQAQYDLLREIQNTSIDSILALKNAEIASLRMQNRSGGGGGSAKLKAEINKLKVELADLRNQIEQLKKENALLTEAKFNLTNELKTTKDENQQLAQTNTELSNTVEVAKQIKISSIESYPVKVSKNGKEAINTKSKKVNKIESCFTIFENDVVEKGKKRAYLVVVDPQGKLIGENFEKVLTTPGGKISYTTYKEFQFDGKKQEMCMSFSDNVKDLTRGTYTITVYIETNKAATSSFELR
jgi:regulator of replication initiation timing